MSFCINCGKEIKVGAKFCYNCGAAVEAPETDDFVSVKEVEKTHNCPNCGRTINSFETNCAACGTEIRSVRSADAVRELVSKLEQIDAKQMPLIEEKRSVMKMIIGKDFKSKDEIADAKRAFEYQKEEEKAELISNFPVPNTKEDILEFMLLA